ncbi:hypothetical protein EV356DRAFT_197649 [Viridothelium virens]|uniref:Uncharacterized protein n=1 Tax=Viridothelium virens TaxID=1048519 RepID=A0A6A6H6W8_VIRVR|nr:hypothetical protein EV356DRAFT_197649 [Viridothelium virens]
MVIPETPFNWVEISSEAGKLNINQCESKRVEPDKVEAFFQKLKQIIISRTNRFFDGYGSPKITTLSSSRILCIIQQDLGDGHFWDEKRRGKIYPVVRACLTSLIEIYGGCPASCRALFGGFQFLLLPPNIRERICYYIAGDRPFAPLVVRDYPPDEVPDTSVKRTQYEVWMEDGSQRTTTYQVEAPGSTFTPGTLNLWQTCSGLYKIMKEGIYQEITFVGTAESALAFLHDRWANRRLLDKFVLRYWFRPRRIDFPYDSEILMHSRRDPWRRLCKLLVHQCLQPEIKLVVDAAFWRIIPWRGPLDDIMLDPVKRESHYKESWRNVMPNTKYEDDGRGPVEFLERIAKIPGRF